MVASPAKTTSATRTATPARTPPPSLATDIAQARQACTRSHFLHYAVVVTSGT